MQLRLLLLSLTLAAPWCLLAPPARADWNGQAAVRLGALMPEPFSSLGPSWVVGVEGGWVAPKWHRRLGVVVDLGLGMPEADGTLQSAQASSTVNWHASVREITVGVSAELRAPVGRFVPYLRVGPRLLIVDALVGGRSGDARVPTTREDSLALGLTIVPGIGLMLSPGQLFLELPVALLWRVGATPQLTGDFNPSTLALAAGYRIFF
jgi:hypothetical protein